ncbi:MAG: class B sortase [Ruminococcaceae bacterium]|nr:class B sortase [Oscillospiraceae bacterium]
MKRRNIVLICLCLAVAFACLLIAFIRFRDVNGENTDLESMRDAIKVYETDNPEESEPVVEETIRPEETEETNGDTESVSESETSETDAATTESETTVDAAYTETSRKPQDSIAADARSLDFESLYWVNPDIYAWIEIPGTKVDYPVLQSPTNDEKYLTTAYDGTYYVGGSIFTQATYNGTDFNDSVTLIYGHTMKSGTLFGQLQSVYSNAESFAEHDEIIIYLPGEVRYYTVFAAVPFDNFHIMHTYDFSTEYWYDSFFKRVGKVRSFSACFNKEIIPEYDDRVIILSTCLNEDSTKRFLVMAVCREDIADNVGDNS